MEKNYLRNDLDTHVMTESISRSFNFRRADGSSFYCFNLTWNYGHLIITGDMGELTLDHYYAMPTFEQAVHWAASGENDYLLGKSNVRPEYDATKTANYIISNANAPILEALNGSKNWFNGEREDGMRQIAQKIRKGLKEKEEIEDYDIYHFEKLKPGTVGYAADNPHNFWSFCEVWEKWAELWKALEGFGHWLDYSNEEFSKIANPAYRREMREAIQDLCCNEEGALALFRNFQNTAYDDYPIRTDYSWSNYRLVSAIRWACQRLIAEGVVPLEKVAA
ncbi:MAG: hypothetical protein ABF748_06500 [Acetobacter orientalis]